MFQALRMEAAGLGLFMISAGFFGTLLESPASPARQAMNRPARAGDPGHGHHDAGSSERGLGLPGAAALVGELYLADISVPPELHASPASAACSVLARSCQQF